LRICVSKSTDRDKGGGLYLRKIEVQLGGEKTWHVTLLR
jgi:hypothetical protein